MTIKPRFCATLLVLFFSAVPACSALAQSMAGGASTNSLNATRTTLDPIPPERGWKALANVLDSLKPGVDTRLEPTATQITDHIEGLLAAGENEKALAMIEKRIEQTKNRRGTDVQLMFLHGRALDALGKTDDAIALYTDMTIRFPELPEPWNNLAVLYARQGKLDPALGALQMALRSDPNYAAARANLTDVQGLIAQRDTKPAGRGNPGSKAKAQ